MADPLSEAMLASGPNMGPRKLMRAAKKNGNADEAAETPQYEAGEGPEDDDEAGVDKDDRRKKTGKRRASDPLERAMKGQ